MGAPTVGAPVQVVTADMVAQLRAMETQAMVGTVARGVMRSTSRSTWARAVLPAGKEVTEAMRRARVTVETAVRVVPGVRAPIPPGAKEASAGMVVLPTSVPVERAATVVLVAVLHGLVATAEMGGMEAMVAPMDRVVRAVPEETTRGGTTRKTVSRGAMAFAHETLP